MTYGIVVMILITFWLGYKIIFRKLISTIEGQRRIIKCRDSKIQLLEYVNS